MTYIIFSPIFCLVLTVSVYVYKIKASKRTSRRLSYLLVFMWFTAMLYLTIFKRQPDGVTKVRLQIFGKMTKKYIYSDSGLIMNIIVFYPSGLLLSAADGKAWLIILIGALFSVSIEVTQYITTRGWFEINDMLTNTMGTAAGVLVWHAVSSIGSMVRKHRITKSE